jgi:hypothetical protein
MKADAIGTPERQAGVSWGLVGEAAFVTKERHDGRGEQEKR